MRPDTVPAEEWAAATAFWPTQTRGRGGGVRPGRSSGGSGWSVVAAVANQARAQQAQNQAESDAEEVVSEEEQTEGEGAEVEELYNRALAGSLEEVDEVQALIQGIQREEEAEGWEGDEAGSEANMELEAPLVEEPALPGPPLAAQPGADPAQPRVARGRLPAMVSVDLGEMGRISYHLSKEAFECQCSQPGHVGCTLSRTSKGRRVGEGVVAGRPLGMLACWMLYGAQCASKEQHRSKQAWRDNFSLAEREAARLWLAQQQGSDLLFACERAQEDGEPVEPPTLAGLL